MSTRERLDDAVARVRGEWCKLRLRLTAGGRVAIGADFRLYGTLDVAGPGRVTIGDGVTVRMDPFGTRPTSLQTMYAREAAIVIEDGVTLAGTHVSAARSVRICRGAWVEDAHLMDSDFHVVDRAQRHADAVGDARDVVIGADAVVGSAVIVLKGAAVGRGAVVRPGSVVMRGTRDGAVVSGFPARVEGAPAAP